MNISYKSESTHILAKTLCYLHVTGVKKVAEMTFEVIQIVTS